MLGYAGKQSLSQAITRAGIAPGGDISHLKITKPSRARFPATYIVNGESLRVKEAAKVLGYADSTSLHHAIRSAGIKPGEDISHLHHRGFGPGNAKTYIVNGQEVKLSEAARLLGYSGLSSLPHRIKKDKIPPGGDITHLIPTKKHMPGRVSRPRIFIINGQEVTISQAARLSGYKTDAGLHHRIRKPEIPDGSDISHLVKRERAKN